MSLLTKIGFWLLSKKENATINKQFINWKKIASILLVVHDNQLVEVVDFINTCKKDNINVLTLVIYNGKPEQKPQPNFEHQILDKKQFTVFELPTEEVVQSLNQKSFDVLVDMGNSLQLKSLALSKLLNAKCKISHFQHDVFDIIISVESIQANSNYLKQVMVYLNMIKQ